jgi:tRNA threonylcarbamoyladenosine biosynthesis protein TsaB
MKLLAVDTSSNACSVALQIDGDVRERHVVEPRAHTRILMPMIEELLADGGVAIANLDAIVLGNGPGSFIGMRIGASVVQGLCFAADLPAVPVSSLLAIAAEAFDGSEHERIVVAQDARMNEVYLGCYVLGSRGLPELSGTESIVAVGELPISDGSCAAAGAAWARYPELAAANTRHISEQLSISVPRAAYLLPTARHSVEAGEMLAAELISPAYVRTKVAEKPSA